LKYKKEEEWNLGDTSLYLYGMLKSLFLVSTMVFIGAWLENNPNGTIKEYLDWLAIYDFQDEIEEETEKVQLMTIHAAKGLEFPAVIIAGCNEGILPSKQALGSGDIEEERRLMYVALTRAKDIAIIAVRPEEKTRENGHVDENPRTRFIAEMNLLKRSSTKTTTSTCQNGSSSVQS